MPTDPTADLYRAVADFIDAEPAAYDQSTWQSSDPARLQPSKFDPLDALAFAMAQAGTPIDCGTTCCIAGTTVHCAPRAQVLAIYDKHHDAFEAASWEYAFVCGATAIELLQLTDGAADLLFDGSGAPVSEPDVPDLLRRLAKVQGMRSQADILEAAEDCGGLVLDDE